MTDNKLTNLADYKAEKRRKKIVQELENIERLLTLIVKGLGKYKKYTPVGDVIRNVIENKALVNAHLKKYKNVKDEN